MQQMTNWRVVRTMANLPIHPDMLTSRTGADGWYLYGITWPGMPAEPPLAILECGSVVAVVRRVPLADYTTEALRERLRDLAALEELARDHNAVIQGIHLQRPILPVKFGSVYPDVTQLREVLSNRQGLLAEQLRSVECCDEWAFHIRVDRAHAEQRAAQEHPELQRLQAELAAATPGRAWFLQRKLADVLSRATDETLRARAQEIFSALASLAIDSQLSPPVAADDGTLPVLRGALLVQRVDLDDFLTLVEHVMSTHPELHCEYSGPWPPYSFVSSPEEHAA
jgi:hypothetical protein